jgi:hypothetical protein
MNMPTLPTIEQFFGEHATLLNQTYNGETYDLRDSAQAKAAEAAMRTLAYNSPELNRWAVMGANFYHDLTKEYQAIRYWNIAKTVGLVALLAFAAGLSTVPVFRWIRPI